MKKYLKLLILGFIASTLAVSCAKKPLTLDDETSMKTLLNANDKQITELVKKEAAERGNINAENLDIEYILRDKQNNVIVVKSKINEK